MAQKAVSVPGVFFVREEGGIREYKLLSNDLQILVAPDSSVPVAGCMVTYRVGSRNEAAGYTGATHLLEHLMFKGSENFNKEKGNLITAVLESNGALLNATTDFDRTNYYEVIPKEHLATAIAIESDRMRHARILEEDRASEMTVVRNEFERHENMPFDPLLKLIFGLAFQAHPYHHPVIGWRSDIEGVSIERLKQFYDDFYWPNNATLTLAGDFDEAETLQLVAESFGAHLRSPKPIPPMYTSEPIQEGERRASITRGDDSNLVAIAHKIPEATHADMPALLVAALILGEGKTSRLYKALVDTALLSEVNVWCMQQKDPAILLSLGSLTKGTSHTDAEKRIKAEYAKLAKTAPTAAELTQAKQAFRASLAARRDGPYALLSSINEDIARGDWTLFVSFPEEVEKVSARDVSRVVKKYLCDDSQSTIGYFIGGVKGKAVKPVRKATKPKKVVKKAAKKRRK